MGPKHGVARGTAVFGSRNVRNTNQPRDLHLSCDRLRAWSSDHDVALDDSPESLVLLDQHLDAWDADVTHHDKVDLINEVAIYVGTVIIKHVPGTHWKVWPNGHPVIQLPIGKTLDMTRMTGDRLSHAGPTLETMFSMARSH
jgi:hypothetical protein